MMSPSDRVITLLLSLIVCPAAADHENNPVQSDNMESLQSRVITLEQKIEEMERGHKEEGLGAALKTQSGAELTISGQVNRALIWADDGEEDYLFHVDNSASSSKLRFIAEKGMSGELTVGSALEFDFRVNNSFSVGQANSKRPQDGTNFRDRRVEVWIDGAGWGRIWVGKGWTASEDSSEQDLSGTYVAGYSDPGVMGGGMRFRNPAGIDDTPRLQDVTENMDGLGRDVRVRYDTPLAWAPVQLRTSTVQGGAFDGALFYDHTLAGMRVAAAMAYADVHRISSLYRDFVNGSISILSGNGINLTAAGGLKQRADTSVEQDPRFSYIKLGYQRAIWGIGKTAFSIDYHQARDLMQTGDRAEVSGFQVVQNFSSWRLDAYLGGRSHRLDRPDDKFEPIVVVMAGVRMKF